MENPSLGAGASTSLAGELDTWKHTRSPDRLQAILDRAIRHEWPAEALGTLLACRLDPPRRWLLAIGGLMALDPEDREHLAEAALTDLRAGPPLPPFGTVKAEAELWASFASPAEVKHYLVAGWNVLPEHDRQSFLRRAA